MQEELSRLLRDPASSLLHDWSHEGPEDPQEDEALRYEALARLQECRDAPETVMSVEDFEEELARAEAAGELPA